MTHDFWELDGKPTEELAKLAKENPTDIELLRMIAAVLPPRRRENARILRETLSKKLLNHSVVAQNSHETKKSAKGVWALGALVLGTIAVGIGQGAGEEIWKRFWPHVEQAFPTTLPSTSVEKP